MQMNQEVIMADDKWLFMTMSFQKNIDLKCIVWKFIQIWPPCESNKHNWIQIYIIYKKMFRPIVLWEVWEFLACNVNSNSIVIIFFLQGGRIWNVTFYCQF